MEIVALPDSLTSEMTWDPFCAQEGVQTLQSAEHAHFLHRILNDVRLHLKAQDLPYTLTTDLLVRKIPLRQGVAPDVALWPGRWDPVAARCGSLALSEELCPALILEVVSANTYEADAEVKPEIYRLAGVGEYWLYDPDEHARIGRLCGWQLVDGTYEPIRGRELNGSGAGVTRYPSAALQTDWGLTTAGDLQLWNPQQGDWYRMTPTALLQSQAQTEQAQAQVQQERTRAEQAQTQVQQERTRVEQAQTQVQQERARALQAEAQVQQAQTRALQDAAEIARLRALLDAQANQGATRESDS